MKKFLNKRLDAKFKIEVFEDSKLLEAINRLCYGIVVDKYVKKGTKKHSRIFYLLDDDYRFLQWISPYKGFTKSRLNLSDIKDISRDVQWKIKNKNDKLFLKIQTSCQEIVLEFPTETDRNYFQQGVQYFTIQAAHHEFLEKKSDQVKHLANILFLNADKDGNRQLSFEETKRLLQELHISINKKYLKKLFQIYDVNGNGQIDQSEFVQIIRDINKKEELLNVFKKYCPEYNQNSTDMDLLMTVQQYYRFSQEEQKSTLSLSEIADLFKSTAKEIFAKSDSTIMMSLKISFYQFSNFVFSSDNCIFDPLKEDNYQDMDRPLSDYFINSSHNTYLMANQLTSESSCQAYINAFLNGCRCVEIDCWDGDKCEPMVYHGHTLTSRIYFKDVIETIEKYAFMVSAYPVILSFENHCSLEQTKRMAYYMKTIFKDKLYLIPKDYEKFEYYNSPNQLKGKFIVKSKGTVEKAVNENSILGFLSESDEEDDVEEGQLNVMLKGEESIIPDFTGNSQYLQNKENGKKKMLFMQKNKEEQDEILLQMMLKRADEGSKSVKNSFLIQGDQVLTPKNMVPKAPLNKSKFEEDEFLERARLEREKGVIRQKQNNERTSQADPPYNVSLSNAQATVKYNQQLQMTQGDTSSINMEEKRLPQQKESHKQNGEEERQNSEGQIQLQEVSRISNTSNPKLPIQTNPENIDRVKEENVEGYQTVKPKKGKHRSAPKIKECKEFLEVTTMFGCHINVHDAKRKCWYISSISEIKYQKLLERYPEQLVEMFKKSFVRLYPSGLRVDSSNYDPVKAFLSGSQIVALNFQTQDIPMLLNKSKFQENGGIHSGYVLKPPYMLHNAKKTYFPVLMSKVVKIIRIQVISGQQLRPENYEDDNFDVVDPYLQVFIRGTDFDEKNNQPHLTSIISDNGFHPIWDSGVFEFSFACPELAIIVFRAMDSDVGSDTQLGIYAAPVDTLRPGYRVLPLRQKSNLEFIEHCFILVKVSIEEKIERS